jgi:hypothetical protein
LVTDGQIYFLCFATTSSLRVIVDGVDGTGLAGVVMDASSA